MKVVVINNGSLAFVELEMKADGFINFGTDLDNPSFAEIARAIGLHGVRIEQPEDLEHGLREGLAHDRGLGHRSHDRATGALDPPRITRSQAKGFTLWATRSVLSGRGDEVLEVARTNLRQLAPV